MRPCTCLTALKRGVFSWTPLTDADIAFHPIPRRMRVVTSDCPLVLFLSAGIIGKTLLVSLVTLIFVRRRFPPFNSAGGPCPDVDSSAGGRGPTRERSRVATGCTSVRQSLCGVWVVIGVIVVLCRGMHAIGVSVCCMCIIGPCGCHQPPGWLRTS